MAFGRPSPSLDDNDDLQCPGCGTPLLNRKSTCPKCGLRASESFAPPPPVAAAAATPSPAPSPIPDPVYAPPPPIVETGYPDDYPPPASRPHLPPEHNEPIYRDWSPPPAADPTEKTNETLAAILQFVAGLMLLYALMNLVAGGFDWSGVFRTLTAVGMGLVLFTLKQLLNRPTNF